MSNRDPSEPKTSHRSPSLGQNSYYDPVLNPPTRPRRPGNAKDDAWIRAFLHLGLVAHIGTRWNDRPFVHPSSYWFDEDRHELVFHSNVVGRLRANSERHDEMCLEISEFGRFLPSNNPLEISLQYRSVMVFGRARVVEGDEARRALYGLVQKYFPSMVPGREYRLIRDEDLARTSVYAVAIDDWSGKENWADRADQTDEHPLLDEEWFAFTSFRDDLERPMASSSTEGS